MRRFQIGLPVFFVLLIVGLVADVADAIFYYLHVRDSGSGFFDAVSWSVTWEYLSSFPGLPLTILGLAPWVFLLALCYWPDRSSSTLAR